MSTETTSQAVSALDVPAQDVPSMAEQSLSRRALLGRLGTLSGGAVMAAGVAGLTLPAQAKKKKMDAAMPNGNMMNAAPMSDAMTSTATMPIPGATQENPFGTLANLSNDIEILNFALVLEHLEAEFYTRVVAANAARPYLRDRVPFAAQKLASDEAIHVTAVTEQIRRGGGTPIEKPSYQFPDNVFISQTGFLTLATALEETGVGAYLGAAPRVKSRDYLQFAASIYGIEARHTGFIRFLSGRTFAPDAKEAPFTAMQVVKRAAPYIVTTGLPSMPMSDSSMSDSSMKSGSM
jgi:hypothetical protein